MADVPERAQDRTRSRVLAYITGVCVVALVLSVVAWASFGAPKDWSALVVLAVVAAVTHIYREQDVGRRVWFSFLNIVVLTSVVLVGPLWCAVVGAGAVLMNPDALPRRARVFNTAMTAVLAMLAGFAYAIVGEHDLSTLHEPTELLLRVGLPLMLADVVLCLANALLLGGVVAMDSGASFRQVTFGMLTTSGLAYVGYGVIGFLWVILWVPAGIGAFSAVLIIPPLYVAKWAFTQYGEEERAHRRTLEALVSAVEVGDPYAVGHSERIARLSDRIGEVLGLGPAQAKALHFAAILHDIGRLTAPTTQDQPFGRNGDELGVVTSHPQRGADLIEEIGFLRDSAAAVRHHHERYDGRGYPRGLRGTQIPLFARIIAVADAFDSLTTSRPGREALTAQQARAELRHRAGTQFDPVVVAALERALEKHPWEPTSTSPRVAAETYADLAFDHDDPRAGDQIADLLDASRLLADRPR